MVQPFVFISYSHKDEREKEALLTHLRVLQHANHLTLWSDDEVEAGSNRRAEIAQAITRADLALLLITANYLSSDALMKEQLPALLSRQAEAGLRLIPVIAKPCLWQEVEWLKDIEVRPKSRRPVWRQAGRYVDQELATLAAEIIKLRIHNLPDLPSGQELIPDCPYLGLSAFRPEHAHLFFGRELFIQKLTQITESRSLVAVLGASGSGKSSVVFAGLVPALAKVAPWKFTYFRPGNDPFFGLAGALIPLLYDPDLDIVDKIAKTRRLATELQKGMLLSDILKQLQRDHAGHYLLLIADQFEELYTLFPDPTLRQKFLDLLLEPVVAGGNPTFHLVLTLRADFMGQALAYRPLADALQEADLKLGPMTRAELTEAIEKPAHLQEVYFEAQLVERLLDDVGEKEGGLPLLEFALTELWQSQEQRTLTYRAYEEIGRVEGALSRHADKVYERLREAEQVQACRLFVQLVNPGLGTEDTRRLAYRTDLESDWPLVSRLANERLVVTNRIEAGQETVELIHEALIRNWQQLRNWLNQDREFLTWRLGLQTDLKRWQETNHDEGALLRGAPLAVARVKLAERSDDLTLTERDYIQASVALAEQEAAEKEARHQRELEQQRALAEEQRKRALWLGMAGMVALILAAVAVIFGVQANQQKEEIALKNYATEAELNFSQTIADPQVRLNYLVQLFDRPGYKSLAMKLFWMLPQEDQVALFQIKDDRLAEVIKDLHLTLADVNWTGYTDPLLTAMAESLSNIKETTVLKAELDQWQQSRTLARKGQYEAARTKYDKLIELNGDNPATYYERAWVLAELSENQLALADLDRVIDLVNNNPSLVSTGQIVASSEFATVDQVTWAIKRLIEVKPELGGVLNSSGLIYPHLQSYDLVLTPTINTDTKGIAMVLVPAGPFEMGSNSGNSNERPIHTVTLTAFYIDQYEVTNAQFEIFLEDRGNQEERGGPWLATDWSRIFQVGEKWQIAAGYANHPVTGVSWYAADAYCKWRGGRLPTEAEWEKSARGTDGRIYPWGQVMTCKVANYWTGEKGCVGDTTAVGAYPTGVSPYGAYDMAGNVWEWVADWYDEKYYSNSPAKNPLGASNGDFKVLRGGSWYSSDNYGRATDRGPFGPEGRGRMIGFRCAASVP